MRAKGIALLLALISSSAAGESGPTVYHSDPHHLWNRLYTQMAVRTFANVQYGVDIAEPYAVEFDNAERLIATLDEFLGSPSQRQLPSGVTRALLLNDVWTAFDVAAALPRRNHMLEVRLARAFESLRMPSAQVAKVEDNYAAAINGGRFARDFNPKDPNVSFLPPDLFDPNGPWVQVGDAGGGLVASNHTQLVSGRSAFMTFIRCPGGRRETLSYLSRLNLHPTPWQLNPQPLGTSYPSQQKVRVDVLRADPNTPEPPAGTIVALVRRMMVVDWQMNPMLTPITQKVQFRVLGITDHGAPAVGRRSQVHEFVMRRKDLNMQMGGGLRVVAAGEKEYQGLLLAAESNNALYFDGPVILDTCVRCHGGNGILTVRSYLRGFNTFPANPQLLPIDSVDQQGAETARWKRIQFNWGLLEGIRAAQETQ